MEMQTSFQPQNKSRKQLKQLFNRFVKDVSNMTPKERFETMVEAGIYSKNGRLSKNYR